MSIECTGCGKIYHHDDDPQNHICPALRSHRLEAAVFGLAYMIVFICLGITLYLDSKQ